MITTKLPHRLDIRIHQGTTVARKITWLNKSNLPALDLTLFQAKMTLKPTDSKFGPAITLHSGTNGGIVLNATEGSITITLTAAQTAAMRGVLGRPWGQYDLVLYPKVGAEPVYVPICGDVLVTPRMTTP